METKANEKYALAFYNKIAKEYEELKESGVSLFHKYLLIPNLSRQICDLKGKKVVDLGCGNGMLTSLLVKKGAKKVFGIDFSKNMVEIAKKRVPNAKFVVGNIRHTDFPSNYFDFALCSLVLDGMRDIGGVLSEINRILKPNGMLILIIRNPFITSTKQIGNKQKTIRKFNYYFNKYLIKYVWDEFRTKMPIYEFHRPMQEFIRGFISNGFAINDYFDLKPKKPKNRNEWFEYNLRVPKFMGFKLKKVEGSILHS